MPTPTTAHQRQQQGQRAQDVPRGGSLCGDVSGGGGARWQQEVAALATLCQEVAAMVAFLQRAVRHRQDIICCRVDWNGQAYRRLRGQRGGGGGTWWSRCDMRM